MGFLVGTGAWTAQQLREAWPDDTARRFLLRDRDSIYAPVFRRTVDAFGVEEVVTAPHAPWQHPFVERLIGTLRRECLEEVIIWNERGLRRYLHQDLTCPHRFQLHLSLKKDAPVHRGIQSLNARAILEIAHAGDLQHHDERRAA